MFGSIDYMHRRWKNFPNACHAWEYIGHHCDPTIMLEAVALKDLWIWHCFFGLPWSLGISMLFSDLIYLLRLQVEKLWLATTQPMAMNNMGSCLLDSISILPDQHLSRPSQIFKVKNDLTYAKKNVERIFRELLVCSWLSLVLFEVLVISRIRNPSLISWQHVWFNTTWSSRVVWIWPFPLSW
jgi:hypothetical protein